MTSDFWQHLIRSGIALAARGGIHRSRLHTMIDQGYRDLNVIPLGAGLTTRQNDLLRYWTSHYAKTGQSPTVRDAQYALNISSTSVVVYNLRVLVDRGYLEHRPGKTPAYITPSGHWVGH